MCWWLSLIGANDGLAAVVEVCVVVAAAAVYDVVVMVVVWIVCCVVGSCCGVWCCGWLGCVVLCVDALCGEAMRNIHPCNAKWVCDRIVMFSFVFAGAKHVQMCVIVITCRF